MVNSEDWLVAVSFVLSRKEGTGRKQPDDEETAWRKLTAAVGQMLESARVIERPSFSAERELVGDILSLHGSRFQTRVVALTVASACERRGTSTEMRGR